MEFPEHGPYTVLDNGSDIATLGQGWKIITKHSKDRDVFDEKDNRQQLVDAIATLLIPTGERTRLCVLRVNNAIYDPTRKESLLPPDQARWHNVTVNDCSLLLGGKQNIITPDLTVNLFWDGKTYFFVHTTTKVGD